MDINLKNIDTRNSSDLYRELEKLVKFKDYHAVVKDEENFYVGGLTIKDIKKASVSQEDIQKLHTGLKDRNISYAIKDSDVNSSYIPLILNDHTRSFLRKNLKGLLSTENLNWRIFYIPYEIIDNNVYLKNAEILVDDSDEYGDTPYALSYEGIEIKLKEIIRLDSKGDELVLNDEVDNDEYKEILGSVSFDNDSNTEDDTDIKNEIVQDDENSSVSLDSEEKTENTSEHNIDESLLSENNISDEVVDESDEHISHSIIDKEDTKIPPEIESFLGDIYLGRFNEYESLDDADTTHILMQKEIKNANDTIAVREQNIKRKAKELFFRYMEQSVKKINEVIDIENGDDLIKNKYLESIDEKRKLDQLLEENINFHKNELEEAFWGKHFETYKEKTMAGLKLQFEKEEYYNLVSEPLENFISSESHRIDNQKDRIEYENQKWIESIKNSALESDRDNAVIEVEEYINKAIKNCQKEISDLEKKMQDYNERFLKHEYAKRAEENLRNTVGSDLYTDEEAKRYKKRFEQSQEEKIEISQKLEELEDKYISDFENMKKERESIKNDIEENHKKVLSEKENELNELRNKTSKLEDENESNKKLLSNSSKKAKRKIIGTSIAAFILVAGFGGTTLSSHNNNKEIQEKIESQNKIIKSKNEEVNKRESEIKKMQENVDKQNKVIAQQKKDLDKKKDKKEDKKKDKK